MLPEPVSVEGFPVGILGFTLDGSEPGVLRRRILFCTLGGTLIVGCITDDRQTHGATQTCLTNTPRDAELILEFEVKLKYKSRLISLFSNLIFVNNNIEFTSNS